MGFWRMLLGGRASQEEPRATQLTLDREYGEINNNIRFLAEVRFKLLGLIPTLGGAAVFVLSRIGLSSVAASGNPDNDLVVVLLVATLGFAATLGVTLYDQRNSELYNALIHRAKHLELNLCLPGSPGGLKSTKKGGQFRERPAKGRHLIVTAGHDLALALIYGPLLGAWLFPLTFAAARLASLDAWCSKAIAEGLAVLAILFFTVRLIRLDVEENKRYNANAKRDKLSEE